MRRYAPREYYQIINNVVKLKKCGHIMRSFKDQVVDGKIIKAVELHEYINKLY